MGKKQEKLSSRQIEFIRAQKIFFVATAMESGRINLSPKGMDAFRVLDPIHVCWLNLTGSGNETAAHLQYNNRMTIMFCAFEGPPLILRLYGMAKAHQEGSTYWNRHINSFPALPGSRQLVEMKVDLVQASCGMGVPYLSYEGERGQLEAWAAELGEEGLNAYRREKNAVSLDGLPTGLT